MITLDLNNQFVFTTKDQFGETAEYKGTFRELTKKELAEFKAKNETTSATIKKAQALIEKAKRITKSIEIKEKLEDWASVDELTKDLHKTEDELYKLSDKFDAESERLNMIKERFELCLGGEQKDEIIDLADTYGYDTLMDIITEAIREGKSNK